MPRTRRTSIVLVPALVMATWVACDRGETTTRSRRWSLKTEMSSRSLALSGNVRPAPATRDGRYEVTGVVGEVARGFHDRMATSQLATLGHVRIAVEGVPAEPLPYGVLELRIEITAAFDRPPESVSVDATITGEMSYRGYFDPSALGVDLAEIVSEWFAGTEWSEAARR